MYKQEITEQEYQKAVERYEELSHERNLINEELSEAFGREVFEGELPDKVSLRVTYNGIEIIHSGETKSEMAVLYDKRYSEMGLCLKVFPNYKETIKKDDIALRRFFLETESRIYDKFEDLEKIFGKRYDMIKASNDEYMKVCSIKNQYEWVIMQNDLEQARNKALANIHAGTNVMMSKKGLPVNYGVGLKVTRVTKKRVYGYRCYGSEWNGNKEAKFETYMEMHLDKDAFADRLIDGTYRIVSDVQQAILAGE